MIEPESSQVPLFSTWHPTVDSTNQESPDMYENVYVMYLGIAEGLTEDGNSRNIVTFFSPVVYTGQVSTRRAWFECDLLLSHYTITTQWWREETEANNSEQIQQPLTTKDKLKQIPIPVSPVKPKFTHGWREHKNFTQFKKKGSLTWADCLQSKSNHTSMTSC